MLNAIKNVVIANLKGFEMVEDRKREDVKNLITRMFVYSAIKIIANAPLLYSILNPDTNSDSPSARSKGVRFSSAIADTTQHKKIGREMKSSGLDVK